jgi:putative phosphoserine phosphatase/1-acylglycerol-3-phosphate O-acyltransferase
MAAGIPIVPIIMRNAEFVAARNSATINPGTVDVAVFPPISLQDWAVDTLPEHIAEVRQLYLDTLANWPVDELPQVDLYAEKKAARKARAKPASKTTGTKVAAKKAAPKKAGPKKAASKSAVKKQPAQPNPNESKVALNNGEAPKPGPDQLGNTESTPRPKGRA